MIFFILVFSTLLASVVISWVFFINDKKKTNVPGPRPLPFLGNAHYFAVNATKFINVLYRLSQRYGDAILVYIMSDRYLIINKSSHIEAIVSNTEHNTKGISYYYIEPWLGQGLLTSSGNRWKTHRKLLTPAFHFSILQNFLPVFCKNTKIFTEKLRKLSQTQESVDLFPLVALAALDNVTESIMGVSVNAQEDSESQYVKAIEDLSNLISTRMRNPFVGEDVIFNLLPHRARQEKALKILHGQTRKVIEARRRELEHLNITNVSQSSDLGIKNKQAFLDLLLLSDIDGRKIDDEKVREEVDTFMFEGHDTTTSGISFALYCIAKNKGAQEEILQELQTIFGDDMDRDPTYNELKEMKYLELVIKESLRLFPSVPFIQRLVKHDCDIAGLKVPKNTSVIIDIYHMQRRKDLYTNPTEFCPERFNNPETKNPFGWLAFSAGPRNCIGQKFAIMEMKVVLSEVIKKFYVVPTDKEPELTADLILRSKNGVHLKLIPRS